MVETVFRWEELPEADRFECWRDMACDSHAPNEVDSEQADDFRATLRVLGLGPVSVSALDCPPLRSDRTPRLIRQSDPELYNLTFTQRGSAGAVHAGREIQLGEGDLMLSTTSLPLRTRMATDHESVAMIDVLFPQALLPLPKGAADRLLTLPFSGRAGLGVLLAQFLNRLTAESATYRPADAERLGAVTLDLAAALLAHHLDDTTPPEAHPEALATRIHTFVRHNLSDPELTPRQIASAHHISLRTLHRVFQREGATVTAWIRQQRLDGARRDLTNPALAARPIYAIAAAWGFTRAADFTHVFRATYGMPPSEYRHMGTPGTDETRS
ncbi:helix-turn-helix domain-containing protein (plasmid) [Streptomyces sp. NBC_00984]|uniref:AraC-like ligand-binding domain-containing protein n=1 Tax=Streptomyces sp. NBC_00984 TaxID=2903700 RepID=UPI002F9077FC|nr:helix-turn-helix domain-containing protein [Streptomyces sp. NBC_00984]